MAELLVERGLQRQTFRLQEDSTGNPLVKESVLPVTVQELRSMEPIVVWNMIYDVISSMPDAANTKTIGIVADCHTDMELGESYACMALGGGNLALFGSNTLYSFPDTHKEISAHFIDDTLVEDYLFPEFGRASEYWAAYTTSIGAMLHEIGHSFDLPHPEQPTPGDIMWRGFDYLNRMVATSEPHHGSVDPEIDVMPYWSVADANVLVTNEWISSQRILEIKILGNGQVTRVPDKAEYACGEQVILTATADLGWAFGGWQGDLTGNVQNPTIVITGDMEITAVFVQVGGQVVYLNSFQGLIGPEWSHSHTDTTPIGGRRFLGQFWNDDVTLTLNNMPPGETALISFDLYVINSWDGNGDPDRWSISANGAQLFQTTFSNVDEYDSRQSYPDPYPYGDHPAYSGAAEVDTLGYEYYGNSVYTLNFEAPIIAPTLHFVFSALNLLSLEDESWGLDNVVVMVKDKGSSSLFLPTVLDN